MTRIVRIRPQEVFCYPGMGGSFRPFREIYRLVYEGWSGPERDVGHERPFVPNYEGTPLPELRQIAKRLCAEHGCEFVDFKRARKVA